MPIKDIDGALIWQGYSPRLFTGKLPAEQYVSRPFYFGGSQVPSSLGMSEKSYSGSGIMSVKPIKPIIGKGGGASVPAETKEEQMARFYYNRRVRANDDFLIQRHSQLLNHYRNTENPYSILEATIIEQILEERGIPLPREVHVIDTTPIANVEIINNEEDNSELPQAEIRKPTGGRIMKTKPILKSVKKLPNMRK